MATTEMATVLPAKQPNLPAKLQQGLSALVENLLTINPNIDADMFWGNVELMIHEQPKLAECTPGSVFKALSKCAQYGMMPGRDAALIPYGKECQFLPEANGLSLVLLRHANVAHIETNVVYSRDEFDPGYMGAKPYHRPTSDPNPGQIIGAYCCVYFNSGNQLVEYLRSDDIQRHRSASRAAEGPAWKNHYGPMARKSALHAWVNRYGHAYIAGDLMQDLDDGQVIEARVVSREELPQKAIEASTDLFGMPMDPPVNHATPAQPIEDAHNGIRALIEKYKVPSKQISAYLAMLGVQKIRDITSLDAAIQMADGIRADGKGAFLDLVEQPVEQEG